jgi:hypothetical protein
MLAPYTENPDSDFENEYFEFQSEETPENRHRWKNETQTMMRCPDGKLEFSWNLRDAKGNKFDEAGLKEGGYTEEEVHFRVLYPTFKQFLKDHIGVPYNPEHKRYGYMHNKLGAKWDWYELGGRWSGMLPLIDCEESKEYELTSKPGWTDQAPVRLIDLDKLFYNKEEYLRAYRWWELVMEGEAPKNEDEKKIVKEGTFYSREYLIDRYVDAKGYAKSCSTFHTYAVLNDDGWKAPGEMGWFGCSTDTPEVSRKWETEFRSLFLTGLDPDTMVSVYDLHI